jgi:hypothetical protein
MSYDIRFDPKTNTGSITPVRSLGASLVVPLILGIIVFENALELLGYYASRLAHVFDANIVIERHGWMADKSAFEDAFHRLCFLGFVVLCLILLGGLRLNSAYRRTRVVQYRHIRSGETNEASGNGVPLVVRRSDDRRNAPK